MVFDLLYIDKHIVILCYSSTGVYVSHYIAEHIRTAPVAIFQVKLG